MSAIDLIFKEYFTAYGFPIILILIVFYIFKSYLYTIRNVMFANYIVSVDSTYDKITRTYKEQLFKQLHSLKSKDWKLRNEGLIRILELNVRTGGNFKYYPKNCHIIAVDDNVHLQDYMKSNQKKFSHVHVEKILTNIKDFKMIPADCVDVVVGMLHLCSVQNVDETLKEIIRVLSPGGIYLFLEHLPEKKDQKLKKWQAFLSVTKIWSLIFNGCTLNRNVEKNIKIAGFKTVQSENIQIINTELLALKYVRTHIIGTAVK